MGIYASSSSSSITAAVVTDGLHFWWLVLDWLGPCADVGLVEDGNLNSLNVSVLLSLLSPFFLFPLLFLRSFLTPSISLSLSECSMRKSSSSCIPASYSPIKALASPWPIPPAKSSSSTHSSASSRVASVGLKFVVIFNLKIERPFHRQWTGQIRKRMD